MLSRVERFDKTRDAYFKNKTVGQMASDKLGKL